MFISKAACHGGRRTSGYWGALEARKLAALFVCGKRVDQPEAKGLVSDWDDAGHLVCNHSYSHLMFTDPGVSYSEFAADFLRNEPIIAPYRQRTTLFRYPFLKEGDTAEKRDGFRKLLKEHRYRVGHVTIDGRTGMRISACRRE
jgi:peptidoglycan/xylan/chitin deacetylase (PgdA/CDA1 family)